MGNLNPRDMVAELVEASYSANERSAYYEFDVDSTVSERLEATGKELLENFPPMAAACAFMSAGWTTMMRKAAFPVHMLAGALVVNGEIVFGKPTDERYAREAFKKSDFNWDGHCWMMCGEHICDASIFRTAYSGFAPPPLADAITRRFGLGRGFLIASHDDLVERGFEYIPQHVLSDDEIAGLIHGFRHALESQLESPNA